MNYQQISRLAVLIGAPGKGKDYLSGVRADLEHFNNFLLSPNGGGWYPNEILSLPTARVSDINSIIEKAYVDYLFVYFSGHGYTDVFAKRRMLCLQDGNIEDLYLLNRSPRQLIIADACRNYLMPGISGIPEFGDEPDQFDGELEARNLFDRMIMHSAAGRIIVHGTQSGQSSNDSQLGGYFTRALLHVGTRINADNNYTHASIDTVLGYVPSVLQRKQNDQLPEITYETGNLNVPFALGVPKPKYRTVPQYAIEKPKAAIGWGEFAFAALIVAAIGSSQKKIIE